MIPAICAIRLLANRIHFEYNIVFAGAIKYSTTQQWCLFQIVAGHKVQFRPVGNTAFLNSHLTMEKTPLFHSKKYLIKSFP